MKYCSTPWLAAFAAMSLPQNWVHADYATSISGYNPGVSAAAGYTDPNSALGEPSRVTPGAFGGPVDPFDPAYLKSQLVSMGAGGSLTVGFGRSIRNDPAHSFGLDFQIFGGAGFVVTNALDADFNFVGTPATDGSLFGAQTGTSRVWVSVDGQTFYRLDPSLAPAVEGLFPTDGQGDFGQPINPSLNAGVFAGLTLEQVRAQYAGSAGGVGYDLSWARDDQGQPVDLAAINFVRVEVVSGKLELDGFSTVAAVPEPSSWMLFGLGLTALGWRRRGKRD